MTRSKTKRIRRRHLGERGSTAMEYGLIAGMISLVILSSLNVIGSYVGNTFSMVGNKLN